MGEQNVSMRAMQDSEASEQVPSASRLSVRSTYELIRETATNNPDQTALSLLEDLKQSERVVHLSYRALLNSIHQVANLLADLGIEPTDVIALLLPRIIETHLVLWGGQAVGIVCPVSPWLSIEQIVAPLQAAQAKLLVAPGPEVSQELWQKAEAVRREVTSITPILQVRGPGKERDGVYAFDALLADYNSDYLSFEREIAPDDIAVSIPIREMTSTPRVISLTHMQLLDAAWALGNVLMLTPMEVLLRGLLDSIYAWW
jgi:fatty-acyl-CoA synthase